MEQNQEKKFVCKFCNKRYPCGKSLGGHIRTHTNDDNSGEAEEEYELKTSNILSSNSGRISKRDLNIEVAAGQSGYGLRENPKKTRRFVDASGVTIKQEMLCKECGKGFLSLKALCGHMACHSEKEKVNNGVEDVSASSEKQKPVMDSQSDTETSAPSPNRRMRSKRMRYKTIGVYSSSFNGNSSSVSEIEQEQEEVAKCLMMLSRDSGCKKGWNSVADSSDNNSVVLEAKSSSIDMRITRKNCVNCVYNDNEIVEMKKPRDKKLKSAEIGLSENSDSGYFNNGPKKADSDVSVDGLHRNYEVKKPKVDYGSGFEDFDAELGKKLNRFKLKQTEVKTDACIPEFFSKNAHKRSKYECLTCKKVFHSHRSLWGHQASHSKVNGCCESTYGSGENSIETDSLPVSRGKNPIEQNLSGNAQKRAGSKKSKGHECPICYRVFKSGQALGGHKRSHFVGGAESEIVVIKQDISQMPGLIDLNLPAPVEEHAVGHAGFVPW
ncbi:zf-C2H2_6 domain-containing protein [Cephalotus follicularis]|uniref:Zf-C2H2_6 domain-containing protein n=1 Tax=Cephalotus follicularis TaxID=3775 RepID=A0A1Q3ANW7_CEPFO|nr:zf-C2H2_6 domain-containing protein [Cephalotus follicularis]